MNGGTRESDMNEFRDELCCLCCLSISKDSTKRKRFHGTSCTKTKAILANLTTARLTLDAKGYICLWTGVE